MDSKNNLFISSAFPYLGRVFRGFRKRAGVSQKDVGFILGLSSPQFVSNVERGKCFYSLQHLLVFLENEWVSEQELFEILNVAARYHISLHLFGKKSRLTTEAYTKLSNRETIQQL